MAQAPTAAAGPMRPSRSTSRGGPAGGDTTERDTKADRTDEADQDRSGGELRHDRPRGPPIPQPPSVRHVNTTSVTLTEVVAVRVAVGAQLVEPHRRPAVVIGERGRRCIAAAGTGAVP